MKWNRCVLVSVVTVGACTPRPMVPTPSAERIQAERRLQYDRAAFVWLENWARIATVGSRLLMANADLCADKARFLGWTAFQRADLLSLFPDGEDHTRYLREAVGRRFAIADTARVIHVIPSSPADRAGLRMGDLIVSAPASPAQRPMEVVVLRNDRQHVVTIPYVPRCVVSFGVLERDDIVALADGRTIQVTSGMLRFASDDADLATVLSHELAHHLLEYHVSHVSTMRYELEADYVAVYLAARGGFEISGTAEFMRRWGASSPTEIDGGGNHPGTAERVVRIEAAVREVEAKQRRGEALVPTGLRVQPRR